MKKLLAVIITLMSLLHYNLSYAEGWISGAGAATCAQVLDKLDSTSDQTFYFFFASWMQGFITAENLFFNTSVLQDSEIDDEFTIIKQYCRQNLMIDFKTAVEWYYVQKTR